MERDEDKPFKRQKVTARKSCFVRGIKLESKPYEKRNTSPQPVETSTKQGKLEGNINSLLSQLVVLCKTLPPDLQQLLKLPQNPHAPEAPLLAQEDLRIIEEWRQEIIAHRKEYPIGNDVSRGQFKFPIPCYNEVDDEPPPSDFKWIENCTYDTDVQHMLENNNYAEFTAGCECDTCDPINCSCIKEMGHIAPYSNDLVQVAPGTPIFECNSKCNCDSTCPNRLLQHDPLYPLEVFKTKTKGWGVRTQVDIPKGAFVCEYVGKILTTAHADVLGKQYDASRRSYLFDLDMDGKPEFTIDANSYGNIARFFNHSCSPNLENYQVWIDLLDKRLPRIAFFAGKDIKAKEELTFDYRYDEVMVSIKRAIPCGCGSDNCRGWLV